MKGFEMSAEQAAIHNERVRQWNNAPRLPVKMPQEFQQAIDAAKGKQKPVKASKGANKTEKSYAGLLALEFPGCEIRFEAISLRMSNGHVYTPDWCVFKPNQYTPVLMVEVKARGKNGFRQPSYQRAKLAYDQCKVEYPMFQFRWAEKQGGIWEVGT